MGKIIFSTDTALLAKAGYVIESVCERWDTKKSLFNILDNICGPDCLFATNTSAISITRIAASTRRPEKVIGTHFMNPVQMKTVEVIRGFHTSDETLEKTVLLLRSMDKDYVVVNDSQDS